MRALQKSPGYIPQFCPAGRRGQKARLRRCTLPKDNLDDSGGFAFSQNEASLSYSPRQSSPTTEPGAQCVLEKYWLKA